MSVDDRTLSALQVETLFNLDPTGRLLSVNEAPAPPAPRFYLGRMRHANRWHSRYDLPVDVAQELDCLGGCEPLISDFSGARPVMYEAARAALERQAPIRAEYTGPSYVFPSEMKPPSDIVTVSLEQTSALVGPLARFAPRLRGNQPCMAVLEDDVVLSLAYTWRWTNRAAAVGVYTLEGYRGKGYAAAVVAAWGQAVQRTSRLPLYGHAWDNVASQAVVRRLGLVLNGDHMTYDAVIFDLFGTLVDTFSLRLHEDAMSRMATALGAPRADFALWWTETTWPLRVLGTLERVEDNVAYICRGLGVGVNHERIAAATEIMLDFTRAGLDPRSDACEVLTTLRAEGYKIGLISDCSPAVPRLWAWTSFASLVDAPIFSCAAHLQKPDPRIYHLACERLEVRAARCLYVGDGSSDELSGARKVGMRAVLIRGAYDDSYDARRPEVEGWQGPEIATLSQLLPLIGIG
jgi:putative hydrolase of the HAD superfamily